MTNSQYTPPKWSRRILAQLSEYQERFAIAGDLEEVFHEIVQQSGIGKARRWYRRQCLKAFPAYLAFTTSWSLAMLQNYGKTALRNIARQKIHSLVNILGLSVGFASCILISLYVSDELSFDRFHKNADSLYAVVCHNEFHGSTGVHGMMGMAELLQDDFPEIRQVVRINRQNQSIVRYKEHVFNENVAFVDPGFFPMFTFPMLNGPQDSALLSENGVVLTQRTAAKYFGGDNPLGRSLIMMFEETKKEFIVTGITQNPPGNSTIDFDFLLNIEILREIQGADYMNNRRWFDTEIYVQLHKNLGPELINQSFPSFVNKHFEETLNQWKNSGSWKGEGEIFSFSLHDIKTLHLNTDLRNVGSRDIRSSAILTGIALLILSIACINFINLTLGRASGRSLEIGVRKIIGAKRKQLIHQFWTETLILAFLAMLGGVFLASTCLPLFNQLAEKSLHFSQFFTLVNILSIAGLLVGIGIVSGSFPSLVMAGFLPVDIFKGKLKIGHNTRLTKLLIAAQFALSVFLIIVTFGMGKQIRSMTRMNMGFDMTGVVVIPLQESGWEQGVKTDALIARFKERLLTHPGVRNVSASSMTFSHWMVMNHIKIRNQTYDVFFNRVFYDYLETLGIRLTEGRDFSREFSTDATTILVNQAFVKEFEFENPLGATVWDAYDTSRPLTIIGVVEDFHLQSLQEEIKPLILHIQPEVTAHNLLVRISAGNIAGTLGALEKTWHELQPDKPYLFSFLDEYIHNAYQNERRWNTIVRFASILTLVITGMGIFALTSLTLSRRIKEIGIRKVLGARLNQIVGMVLGEFLVLVAIANAVAWPFAYWVTHRWLQRFAYRISLGPEIFFFAGCLLLAVALTTVSWLAVKAALADPVKALRIE